MTDILQEYQTDSIWIKEYPIHSAGCDFSARMTIVRSGNGKLFVHSPCEIDASTQAAIEKPAFHSIRCSIDLNQNGYARFF